MNKRQSKRSARGSAARLGVGFLLALGGCNWILNLDDAAPTADAGPMGLGGGGVGGGGVGGGIVGSNDASTDMVAVRDVVVGSDVSALGDARDVGVDVSSSMDVTAPNDAAGQRDVTLAVDASAGDATTDDVRAEAEAGLPPILSCASRQVTGTGTPLATGTTAGGTDSFTGTCGTGTGNDIAFDWIVPATDYYSVNTIGSSFDTVLYLRDSSCTGTELACNNNTPTVPQSEIVTHLNQGQRVLAVVDGNVGAVGTVAFNAERVTCPVVDLTGQPLPATLSTVGGTNVHTGACGGLNQLESTYRFTPTQTGLYSITARSTDFMPALYVEQGPRCGGTLLGCNKGGNTASSYPAEVIRNLTAGQPVTITVDGGSGFFTLNTTRIIDDAGVCGAATPPDDSVMVTIPGRGVSHSTGSCVNAGGLDGVGSGPFPYADLTYNFPVTLGQSVSCRYQFDANGPITVYLVQNACSGSETKCLTAPAVAGSPLGYQTSFNLSMLDNGMYTLVVENGSFFNVTFTISAACIA